VLDFGTGTGVLAILAERLGASSVVAIDNDDWSIENASENILFNDCANILLQKSDRLRFEQQFDIILANINRNVLLANMESLQQHLKRGGVLLMSGLLAGDREVMEGAAGANKLSVVGELQKDNWISLQLTCY
jgi:ribosomal protein L11 methyltransferase